jgi:hypothetical protein
VVPPNLITLMPCIVLTFLQVRTYEIRDHQDAALLLSASTESDLQGWPYKLRGTLEVPCECLKNNWHFKLVDKRIKLKLMNVPEGLCSDV